MLSSGKLLVSAPKTDAPAVQKDSLSVLNVTHEGNAKELVAGQRKNWTRRSRNTERVTIRGGGGCGLRWGWGLAEALDSSRWAGSLSGSESSTEQHAPVTNG